LTVAPVRKLRQPGNPATRQPGNRTVYRESGIKDQLEGRPVMTDGGYQEVRR
jgi:hypothetical protein